MVANFGWIRRLFATKTRCPIKRAKCTRLSVETLEDRFAPSVNHAPVTMDGYLSTQEDVPLVFSSGMFFFNDPYDNPANNFQALRIASLPGAGTLTLDGSAVTQGDYVSLTDINAGKLVFTPGADENGMPYTSFTFQVQDDGGTAGGGADTSPAQTMNLTVNAVNDNPDFAASDPPTVTEYGDPVSMPNWATFNPGGGADEANQTASYYVGIVSNPSLFAVLPAVSSNGTLTYTLASYVNGESTFEVSVQDNQGGIGPIRSLRITAARVLAPFVVNTIADTPDANPGDGMARDANGNTSLRAAIMEGNVAVAANPPQINFNLAANSTISLGSVLPDFVNHFTINGPGSGDLTITRGALNAFRIFAVMSQKNVNISGVTITNGRAAGTADSGGMGGAILNIGNLSMTNVVLQGNHADYSGGAIANVGTASLTIQGSSIYFNTAGNFGGGIYTSGTATISGATHIAGCSCQAVADFHAARRSSPFQRAWNEPSCLAARIRSTPSAPA